ncbi:MAG: DsbA family protein [Eubacteriales bacterium]|nr:DsbA family protein [Eubacteriales bacterium]
MEIIFVIDFVCPYCIVAEEALKQALAETGAQAAVKLYPYELTVEPQERVDTFHDEKRRAGYQVLETPAKQLGLNIKLPPAVVPRPYTRLAFEGWHYAQEKGVGDAYADSVYRAYFMNEKNIGEIDVLTELAVCVGLDAEDFKRVLKEGIYIQAQKEAVAYAKQMFDVQYVPTVYIDGKKADFDVYQKENWVRVLKNED